MASNLQELDLTDNLLPTWGVLSEFAAGLPRLRCLNLSCNIMTMPAGSCQPPNTALQVLVLNSCRLSWSEVSGWGCCPPAWELSLTSQRCPAPQTDKCCCLQVLQLQHNVPNLRELHLCNNDIKHLSHPADQLSFSNLQVDLLLTSPNTPYSCCYHAFGPILQLLDLENNQIEAWEEVASLSNLPCLQHLWLGGNHLRHVTLTSGTFRRLSSSSLQQPQY